MNYLSNKKLNATQKKLLEIFENLEENTKRFAGEQSFDFVCINDYCPGRGDERILATAWKNKKNKYGFFCHVCGNEATMTKKEFKITREKLSREQAHRNMEKEKKEIEKARKERKSKEAA